MTASGIASRIIGFFYRIFLAQTIGAEALGIYQLIAPVFAMCFALTASSIQTSISKFVGDACGKNAGTSQGEITARGYLLLGLVISCTASVIVGIFLYTQADWIALHFLGELRCAPLLSLLSFPCFPAASTPVSTVITMEKSGQEFPRSVSWWNSLHAWEVYG